MVSRLNSLVILSLLVNSILSFSIQIPFLNQQPDSTSPNDFPYRDLPWSELNIIAITDSHGWIAGHQHLNESNSSGDWGDLYSFVTAMKLEAKRRGVDLLIVDGGDRVDGNGLVDAEPPSHAKGYSAMKIYQNIDFDVITTGNHELYQYPISLSTYENLVQFYGDRYLTSNVNITIKGEDGTVKNVQMGNRYRKFTTEQGKKVTALSPIFNFKAHSSGTTVQSIPDLILEPWFQSAISSPPDLFLLVGHMSLQIQPDSEWTLLISSIRLHHPTVPIVVCSGHHHIRDAKLFDENAMGIASGRYMETVGWVSVSGFEGNKKRGEKMKFDRRYLDQNRNTYKYHAGEKFDTEKGKEISQSITDLANSFNLTHQFGTAPQSYYLYRAPPTSSESILNLMTTKVLPLLVQRPDLKNRQVTILNSGSIRFDIFKGPFSRNDQWIILPFTNNFQYIESIPRKIAIQLLDYLNIVGEHGYYNSTSSSSASSRRQSVESIYQQNLINSYQSYTSDLNNNDNDLYLKNLTYGYVTNDAFPGDKGDDTLHLPYPAFAQPEFVATEFPPSLSSLSSSTFTRLSITELQEDKDEEPIDVVFFDFISIDIILALNYLQSDRIYGMEDVKLYIEEFTANTLMQIYAERVWN